MMKQRGAFSSGPPKRGPVVSLSGETLVEFIGRERLVSTASVASRFGWTTKRALRELTALHDEGTVEKKLGYYPGGVTTGACAMNGWSLAG
jgi:hypothetical protein